MDATRDLTELVGSVVSVACGSTGAGRFTVVRGSPAGVVLAPLDEESSVFGRSLAGSSAIRLSHVDDGAVWSTQALVRGFRAVDRMLVIEPPEPLTRVQRRQAFRLRCELPGEYAFVDGGQLVKLAVTVTDLSEGGAAIESRRSPASGTAVVRISVSDGPITAVATIVDARRGPWHQQVRLRFEQMLPEDRRRLASAMRRIERTRLRVAG